MAGFTAFYDANVLYPAELRNLLMHLAVTGLFRAKWSADVAAAIRGQANVIVTMNLRDFPSDVVAPFGIEAQHPDEFVLHLLDLAPDAVVAAAQDHRQSLKNPTKTVSEYLEALERQGLTQTTAVLRERGMGYSPAVQ